MVSNNPPFFRIDVHVPPADKADEGDPSSPANPTARSVGVDRDTRMGIFLFATLKRISEEMRPVVMMIRSARGISPLRQ